MHHLIQNITHTTVKRVFTFEVFMFKSPVEQDGATCRLRLFPLSLRLLSRPFQDCNRLPTTLCLWFTAQAVCSFATEFDEVSRRVVIETIKKDEKIG